MRLIFLLFDSLNRAALGAYGGSLPTPNFDRLAERCMVFDTHYVGSMPCMPARRDMHTGRLNFLHRSWGPLEPFDDSFVNNLRGAGIYTHLTTDHNHYFEDGGATYHTRYNSYDFIRGQEHDAWAAMVKPPLGRFRETYHANQFGGSERIGHRVQGMINETRLKAAEDFPLHKCFDAALDFLAVNGKDDNWLLQLECFDPHEPFATPQGFRDAFPTDYEGPLYTWPQYRESGSDTPAEVAEVRANYGALVTFCDQQLGRLLDVLDANSMWDDTAVILTTDHGFMLGEHDWWGKNRMPFFNEIANIPLMVHHPRLDETWGTRCDALTATADLSATICDLFDVPPGENARVNSLLPLMRGDVETVREIALYGIFGGALNATDGRYTYFRYPEDMEAAELYEYTLMPMHTGSLFETRELEKATLVKGFDFTKGVPVLKVPALSDAKRPPMQGGGFAQTKTCLFDLQTDPAQLTPLRSDAIEARLHGLITAEMRAHDAPEEIYRRFQLPGPSQE